MTDPATTVERIAARATTLYSRPSVAAEIVRLTEAPQLDARAIRHCLEGDPALACRILRVVNSSSFGLRVQVGDLNQAIALLGAKPLKLLALGFSLPGELFMDVEARQLEWYWTNALTRAVTARILSEQLWRQPGEEAFTAALVADIGILALLRELGQPYARFLAEVIRERCDLSQLERQSLGFDHAQLSAVLLAQWGLPARIVAAVASPKHTPLLAEWKSPAADLPQILRLADLLAELVSQRRLHVLVELLEAGEAFHALTIAKLQELIAQLQPQVDELASALSVELAGDRNYVEVFREAHARMGELSGELLSSRGFRPQPQLAAHVHDLTSAVQSAFDPERMNLDQRLDGGTSSSTAGAARPGHASAVCEAAPPTTSDAIVRELSLAADRCRVRREELSLLLVEPNLYDARAIPLEETCRSVRRAVSDAARVLEDGAPRLLAVSNGRIAVILPNCERRAAVSIAHHAISNLNSAGGGSNGPNDESIPALAVGIATAAGVPKNFSAADLLQRAERCLAAAGTCGISAVKSIEV